MKSVVRKKLFNLFSGELAATICFAGLWIMYIQVIDWARPYLTSFSTVYAFIFLEFILLQGSYYWYLKWKQIGNRDYSFLPARKLNQFVWFKRLNFLLIAIGTCILIYQFIVFPVTFYWYLLVFLFATIEHINYYHIRLSYQSIPEIKELFHHKKLRSSKLADELKQISSPSKPN